jgi:calcium binding protein 39
MAFLFGSKKGRNPSELVKSTKESMALLDKSKGNSKNVDKAKEVISTNLAQMKAIYTSDPGVDNNQEIATALTTEVISNDLIIPLIHQLGEFEFEAKKDTVTIFNHLLRRQQGSTYVTVDYICSNTSILEELVSGYEDADVALSCGQMLRECLRHDALAKIVLFSDQFFNFFKYVEMSNFDVASDAFSSFKELLTAQKVLAAEFLEKNYDQVFEAYVKLLTSENYVTRKLFSSPTNSSTSSSTSK